MSLEEMNSSLSLTFSDSENVDKDGRSSRRTPHQPAVLVHQCDSHPSGHLSPLLPCGSGSPIVDVKLQGQLRLERELIRVKEELKLKDDEVEKLSRVRDRVVEELDELTSSLFQEAYDMVNKAKEEKAMAEKKMHESVSKVEMLQAEVSALKHLVRETQPGYSARQSQRQTSLPNPPCLVRGDRMCINGRSDLNSENFQEFQKWLKMPSLSRDDGFLASCYDDDIRPCMRFQNRAFADNVLVSIEHNKLCMEAVAPQISCPNYCTLSGPAPKPCKFQVKLEDTGSWHFICQGARNRIAAVCDFYSYLRYIIRGIVKTDVQSMFRELIQLRAEMALSRLGISISGTAKD